MRKNLLVPLGVIVFVGLLFLNPLQAGAITLIDETFNSATIWDHNDIDFTDSQASIGKWIDAYDSTRTYNGKGWEVEAGGPTGKYAKHWVDASRGHNVLMYGVDLTDLPARRFWLDFDYVATNNFNPIVALRVISDGQHELGPSTWFPIVNPDDQNVFLAEKLDKTDDNWLHASFQGYIPFDYDVLQFGINGVGNQGLKGIDNVKLTAVPEPATIFLLGSGLIGLVGFSRRKIFKK